VSYQVIARKWRPQSFQELVGQDHVSTTLLNALRNNRLPQALLFAGVRGTGKTSTARILAKSLRCQQAKDYVPCGQCSDCEDIAASRSLDVIEIDGASNNGVDAIRELRDTVGYMPSSGRYKVYIIDEVHMLSTSAFNALLKTLEEPPAHVVFIMATTEAQKLPNTILSRCQRFDFRRVPSRQIAAHLAKICDAEGIRAEQEAVWLIARLGDGSHRDAQSLLDQAITFCGGEVTLAKVIDVLGLTDRTLLLETLGALVHRDSQAAVDVIEKIFKAGYDPKVYAQDLLEELRHALLIRLSPEDPTRLVDLPDSEIAQLKELTAALGDEDIHFLFDMTLKGVNDLLRSQDPRIVLEMLLLRMAAAPRIASLAAFASGQVPQPAPSATPPRTAPPYPSQTSKSGAVKSTAPGLAPGPTTSPAAAATPPGNSTTIESIPATATADASAKATYTVHSFTRPAVGYPNAKPAPYTPSTSAMPVGPDASPSAPMPQTAPPAEEAPEKIDPARAKDPWYRFVDQVKKSNSLLGAMLENTHMVANEGASLVIGVPKKMSFMFDKVKEPDNVRRIEAFLETLWNKKCAVEVVLADEKVEKATPKAMAEQQKEAQKKSLHDAIEQNPLVQTAQNVFKTQIKSIKDAGASKNPKGS
jgi:DNA polymerase-3 subunit gamma/tau